MEIHGISKAFSQICRGLFVVVVVVQPLQSRTGEKKKKTIRKAQVSTVKGCPLCNINRACCSDVLLSPLDTALTDVTSHLNAATVTRAVSPIPTLAAAATGRLTRAIIKVEALTAAVGV